MTAVADAKKICSLLLRRYPEPMLALHFSNPLELLVAVILSAQCTDARVNAVTRALFGKYRTAQDYAQADLTTFEGEIRPTGFYRNKARSVTNCCKAVVERFGGRVPEDLDDLVSLPGVGRKTANMVLGNAFGIPGIAVDTHVLRVSTRLGLAASDDPVFVEQELQRQLPKSRWTAFSNATILHGRDTCTARKPKCGDCVLREVCLWPDKSGIQR